jgi:hypothetical protein
MVLLNPRLFLFSLLNILKGSNDGSGPLILPLAADGACPVPAWSNSYLLEVTTGNLQARVSGEIRSIQIKLCSTSAFGILPARPWAVTWIASGHEVGKPGDNLHEQLLCRNTRIATAQEKRI